MSNLGYYFHVPWCRRRCPYCDFYLVVNKTPDSSYAQCIIKEYQSRIVTKKSATTMYFGGGTPSLLPSSQLDLIINFFKENNLLTLNPEITLELNPEDVNLAYVKDLTTTLVNRISLGIQSFDDAILKFLGRAHTKKQALTSIELLLAKDFNNISIDLIIGVDGENLTETLNMLDLLGNLGVKHFSTYLLTIESSTNFHKRIINKQLKAPSDDYQAYAYETIQQKLLSLGFIQYEISSFAKDNFFSKHNQLYWSSSDYLGFGPSSHSMTRLSNGGILRTHNKALLADWLVDPTKKDYFVTEFLDPKEALKEALAFGLRNMHTGMNPLYLSNLCQSSLPANFYEIMLKFIKNGMLQEKNGIFFITHKGALFADLIIREALC